MHKKIALLQAIVVESIVRSASAACPDVGGTFTIDGVCNVQTVQSVCPEVTNDAARRGCQDASIKFEDIAGNHYQYDKEYMDGGTVLNDVIAPLPNDAGRITAAADNVANDNVIAWPEYEAREFYEEENYGAVQGNGAHMTNFDLDEGCDLRTVMCCFVDNANGIFDDNTEVCHMDLHAARRSNHVSNGYAYYGAGDESHCVGFSWEDGEESDALKGNALFHISYLYRMEMGYAKNVPGAPMCACIEQMPSVEKASCVNVSGSATFTFTYNGPDDITGTNTADVTYGECGGDDLKTNFAGSGAELAELDNYLVGDGGCEQSSLNFKNDKFLVPTTKQLYVTDEAMWEQWAGYGLLYYPFNRRKYDESLEELDTYLRNYFAESSQPIVYRHCKSCLESHQHIYYKRITAWPSADDQNIADLFLNNWSSTPNNERDVDFNLYSSYEDALNNVDAWSYCNYDGGVGFARDCGPMGYVGSQWINHKHANGPHFSWGFYALKN